VHRELKSLIKKSGHYAILGVYQVTTKGREFISTGRKLTIPLRIVKQCQAEAKNCALPLTTPGNPTKTVARIGKGTPPLKIIRQMMAEKENWKMLTNKSEYQYPGVYASAQRQCVYAVNDYKTLEQSAESDPHFIWNDIQLSKGKLNKDRLLEMDIGGKKESVHYRSAPCGGVKVCSEPLCNYVAAVREKRNCKLHPSAPLNHVKECPVEFAYLYPQNSNDNRRWIIAIIRNQKEPMTNLHSHAIHGPTKIAKCVQENISKAVSLNSTITPIEISQGKGLEYVPGVIDKASTHLGRIRTEVRKAKLTSTAEKTFDFLQLEQTLDKNDAEEIKRLGDATEGYAVKKLSRPYLVSAGLEDGVKYIFTMNPYMSELLSKSEFIQTDITYNVSTEFTYLFNAVAFDYHLMEWEVVARVHLSHQNGNAHALAFTKMFKKCKADHPNFQPNETLLGVVTDWSDAEINGLKSCVGEDEAMQLLKGCKVHWIRSWHRVRDRVVDSTQKIKEKQIFNKIATAITHCDGHNALECFKVLCSQASATTLVTVVKDLSLEEAQFVDKICNWTSAKKWVEWWIRPQHLKMLHRDYADMDLDAWKRCPHHQPMLLSTRIETAKPLLHKHYCLH